MPFTFTCLTIVKYHSLMKIINHIAFLVLLFLLMSSNNAKAQRNVSVAQNGDLAVRIEGQIYVCLSANGQIAGFGVPDNGFPSYFNNRVDRIGTESISYFNGKIDKVGNTTISYFNGNVDRAGNVTISYFNGRVDRIGKYSISYFNNQIDKVGDENISYFNGRIDRIGNRNISSGQEEIQVVTLSGSLAN